MPRVAEEKRSRTESWLCQVREIRKTQKETGKECSDLAGSWEGGVWGWQWRRGLWGPRSQVRKLFKIFLTMLNTADSSHEN